MKSSNPAIAYVMIIKGITEYTTQPRAFTDLVFEFLDTICNRLKELLKITIFRYFVYADNLSILGLMILSVAQDGSL